MGEWKRILSNPRRLALLLAIPLICIGLFLYDCTGSIQLSSWQEMIENNQFYQGLVREMQDYSLEEAQTYLTEQSDLLSDVVLWTWGWALEDKTAEEVAEMLAGYPDLAALIEQPEALRAGTRKYSQAYAELQEQLQYLIDYPGYLAQIQTQAETQSQTTIFGDPNSFSYRNLQKTAGEFRTIQDVTVEMGNNRGMESWIAFDLADYLYVVVLIVFVLAFLEERKKGLWSTIRSCQKGRMHLGWVRVGILFVVCAIYTLLLYGINLVLALELEGGWEGLGRSLQSLMSFKTCPIPISIGGWIVQYLLVKVASGFLIGVLLWCVLGWISNIQFSVTVLAAILIVEYVLFATLPVQSILNPLKYFNLFSYIQTSKLYTQYLNIDLFGYPFGIRTLALWALPFLLALFLFGALWVQRNRYPAGNRDWLSKFAHLVNRVLDLGRRHLSIGGMETYKTLLLEWSILLLVVLYVFAGDLQYYTYQSDSGAYDMWYEAYLRDAEGPADSTMDDYLANARALADPNDGQLQSALDQLEARVQELRQRAEEGGYEPWLLQQEPYRNLYGDWPQEVQRRNATLAMIVVALCSVGLVAYERQAGVVYMLRSVKRGRRGIFRRKTVLAVLLAVAVSAILYGHEILRFLEEYQPSVLAAPVQNLDFLQDFPLKLSISGYMALTYGLRTCMLILTAFVAMFIGSRANRMEGAYMLVLGILGVPALLLILGLDVFGWVSPAILISTSQLLNLTASQPLAILPWILWAAAGGLAWFFSRKYWVR